MFVTLPASPWTGLSYDIHQPLILANLPASPSSQPVFQAHLITHLSPAHCGHGHPCWPRTSHTSGFQACVLHCFFFLSLPHLENKTQSFSSRPKQDGTSSEKSSQNYSAPPPSLRKWISFSGFPRLYRPVHCLSVSVSIVRVPGDRAVSESTYISSSWDRHPQKCFPSCN